jgi:hypothetical protein
MFSIQKNAKVVLYSKPVNLIKGPNALAAIVQNELKMEIDLNTYFLFCNFKRDRFKILYLDGTNLAIWFKRLDGTLSFKFSGKTIIYDSNKFVDFISNIRTNKSRFLSKII